MDDQDWDSERREQEEQLKLIQDAHRRAQQAAVDEGMAMAAGIMIADQLADEEHFAIPLPGALPPEGRTHSQADWSLWGLLSWFLGRR